MFKIVNSLPASMYCWRPVKFDDAYALASRFGCHSNYAYLVIVNTNESIVENVDYSKISYFSSADNMQHVANIIVDESMKFGTGWEITTTSGFGLRYVGD